MNPFRAVDDFMIDQVFQPVADWLGRWTTPCGTAEFLFVGLTLSHVVSTAWAEGWKLWVGCVMFPVFVGMIFAARRHDRRARDGLMPTVRLTWLGWRFPQLICGPWALITITPNFVAGDVSRTAANAGGVLFFAGLYFMACRRNPPKQQREKSRDLAFGGAS